MQMARPIIDFVYFRERDVLSAIKNLRSNFILGPDGFPSMFLRNWNTLLLHLWKSM